jgi:hypothetical protein
LHGPYGFDITAAAKISSCPTQLKEKYTKKGLCEMYTNPRKHTPQFGVQILKNLQSLGYGYIIKWKKRYAG